MVPAITALRVERVLERFQKSCIKIHDHLKCFSGFHSKKLAKAMNPTSSILPGLKLMTNVTK